MKTILVPIDLSRSNSIERVMDIAKKLADIEGASINLFYAMEPVHETVRDLVPTEMIRERKAQYFEKLQELAEKFDLRDATVSEVAIGHPANCILNHASDISADLIILSSRDPDDINFFLGSVAHRITRRAHCSVYVVR